MEFEIVTQYNRRAMLELNWTAAGLENRWLPWVSHGMGLVVSVIFLVQGARLLGQQGGGAAVLLIFGGVLLVWSLFLFHIRAWMTSAVLLKGNQEHRTHFDADGFTVTNAVGQTRLSYAQVWRAARTKGYYILMLDKRHGYVVDRTGFVQGDDGAFAAFLADKLGRPLISTALLK